MTESYMNENDGRSVLGGSRDGEEPKCGGDSHGNVFLGTGEVVESKSESDDGEDD